METIPAKTIVTRAKSSSWFGMDYNMNIYRGCSHGCIYCDSRSLCYQNPDFDKIKVKEDALRIIRDDLQRKVKKGVIATGSMSDPYNPLEKELELTRNALQLIYSYGFGVSIATKGILIERDLDILKDIAEFSPVLVKMTITTMDEQIAAKIEPNAPSPKERIAAVKHIADAGIPAGILLMPILPFVTDTEENILGVVHAASEAGARFVYPSMGMTLREGNREYFYAALDRDFPGIKQRYSSRFGNRYECSSPKAKALWELFCAECDRLGLLYKMKDIISCYKMGYPQQLALELP